MLIRAASSKNRLLYSSARRMGQATPTSRPRATSRVSSACWMTTHLPYPITLAIPDRPGNNRLDTWENLVENSAVGLLFMIPGMNETLRINGEARLTLDAELCGQMHVNNRPALAVCVVKVREVYMHCAKAFIRSRLWSPDTWSMRTEMPTLGEMLKDQARLSASAAEFDGVLDEAYKTTLW
ncbi:pyridoxamine 5'-phosphate oxidase family protein [Sulfitobacter pseudonitzschiae]|nr:pyridoxamine 5'-phosphate oxidase family protein [Pseudosulfitobacter pseudonitzschiae]MBM2212454.1 pyridoxamine 5'-phosphate oxidase family protein [Pseudosulfitobacter pseudonitzschiae]MBM2236718.1 pyridoxamine 5'-phosphate oxidase family protein [Pseudosulfitobacter pseudonitzschiae]MCD2354667.1 pyridoxamine 5'-phosphate oxidase family protein [Pseudosulfitobacter pseudonitzschiae]